MRGSVRVGGAALMILALLACSKRPEGLGIREGVLAPCPSSPNCVSSDAPPGSHHVEPFALAVPAELAWPEVRDAVEAMPRTTVEDGGEAYLHAECRSRWLGFVDDLELHLRPERGEIAVRSASRVGYSDLGVNRARVERLRALLRDRGLLR